MSPLKPTVSLPGVMVLTGSASANPLDNAKIVRPAQALSNSLAEYRFVVMVVFSSG